jgi:predicted DsbA family dithiol-disulfide isomerase
MEARMKVEIWSDVVCPWCYIGKRRLESALAHFRYRDQVELQFKSFELNPAAEPSDGKGLDELLAGKYRVPLDQARAMNARVSQAAEGEGLAYRLDIARPGNTFDAHRLIQLAALEGRQPEMKERLMAAYFTEGKAIDDVDTLVALAAETGLEAERARAALETDEFAVQVRADEHEAAELGVTGVPFFVIDRRYSVSGAQSADLFLEALNRAWKDGHPLTAIEGSEGVDCADGSCALPAD